MSDEGIKVVTLRSHDLQDIPACMRNIADQIEAGNLGEIISGAAILMAADGTPTICGWGRTNSIDSIGLFMIAVHWLAAHNAERT